jgi:hypothetical protein
MEDKTEKVLCGSSPLDTKARLAFNRTISTQIDSLVEMLVEIQDGKGNSEGGRL